MLPPSAQYMDSLARTAWFRDDVTAHAELSGAAAQFCLLVDAAVRRRTLRAHSLNRNERCLRPHTLPYVYLTGVSGASIQDA